MPNINASRILNNFSHGISELMESLIETINLRITRIYLLLNIISNAVLWYACYKINSSVSQDLIVLHYNVDYGINLVGSVKTLYNLPLISLVFIFLNFSISSLLKKEGKLILNLLLATPLLANIFLMAAVGFIYLINFT